MGLEYAVIPPDDMPDATEDLARLYAIHAATLGARLAVRLASLEVERDPSPLKMRALDVAHETRLAMEAQLVLAWVQYGHAAGLVENVKA